MTDHHPLAEPPKDPAAELVWTIKAALEQARVVARTQGGLAGRDADVAIYQATDALETALRYAEQARGRFVSS